MRAGKATSLDAETRFETVDFPGFLKYRNGGYVRVNLSSRLDLY